MTTETQFPKTYKSSSAAYRAIRQFEEKNGKKDFIMEKLMENSFLVTIGNTKSFESFQKELPEVSFGEKTYRYYSDGVRGEGYYEQKTGNRRRPNSIFKTIKEIYDETISK